MPYCNVETKTTVDQVTATMAKATVSSSKELHIITLLGASGDLAKKKIYPTLWALYRDGRVPENTHFLGYARSQLDITAHLTGKCHQYMKLKACEQEKFNKWVSLNHYLAGSYDKAENFQALDKEIKRLSAEHSTQKDCNRVFFLALPPSVYTTVTALISKNCKATESYFTRCIVEKPFGKDLDSSNALSKHIQGLFTEDQVYRIDHYLGKEMVQNIIVMRFANKIFKQCWNRDCIESVTLTFKEPFGTQGRGGYFDEFGIIRDIMQNHLLQVLSLIAMETPASQNANDIRDEKVKVLKSMAEIQLDDIVVGQYEGNPEGTTEDERLGYLDDPTVPNGSKTPTFACAVLKINNERWEGVPFIMKSGKALNERKAEVRIQFKECSGDIFDGEATRNELIIRLQPNDAMYLKIAAKQPGMNFKPVTTELDLTYKKRYADIYLPEAYERLILDCCNGNQTHFVRSDELVEAWRVFTPILKKIEAGHSHVYKYKYGARTLKEADDLIKRKGNYHHSGKYNWSDEVQHVAKEC